MSFTVHAQRIAVLAVLFLASLFGGASADGGTPPACFGLCSIDCVKPISIPDRWDDFSVPTAHNWLGNGTWDSEKFTDTNGNGLYDPGEPFVDGSSLYTKVGAGPINGKYDAEYYDPLNTGYVAWKDSGLEITLKQGSVTGFALFYYPLNFTGQLDDPYQQAWSGCSPVVVNVGGLLQTASGTLLGPTAVALRDLIDQDPGAYWDDGCQCVNSSMGEASPRLFVIVAHDPRFPLSPGGQSIHVTKLIGMFLEAADVNATLKGRLVVLHRSGDAACPSGDFVVDCAVPTTAVTWGAVKASYR